jgi:uncharacterized protein YjiS (DUF1127 family)
MKTSLLFILRDVWVGVKRRFEKFARRRTTMCTARQTGFDRLPGTPEERALLRTSALKRAREERVRALRAVYRGALASGRAAGPRLRRMVRVLAVLAGAAARRWWTSWAGWLARRNAARELAALDDRSLKDLGLHRSEIESVVRGRDPARLRENRLAAALLHKPYPRRPGAPAPVHDEPAAAA